MSVQLERTLLLFISGIMVAYLLEVVSSMPLAQKDIISEARFDIHELIRDVVKSLKLSYIPIIVRIIDIKLHRMSV